MMGGAAIRRCKAIIAIEMSRINPGLLHAFGALMGLAGGAIMAKGPRRRRALGPPDLTMEKSAPGA
jgi:hypothetical protein